MAPKCCSIIQASSPEQNLILLILHSNAATTLWATLSTSTPVHLLTTKTISTNSTPSLPGLLPPQNPLPVQPCRLSHNHNLFQGPGYNSKSQIYVQRETPKLMTFKTTSILLEYISWTQKKSSQKCPGYCNHPHFS